MESNSPSALFINRVYPPQEGATGQLLAELAGHLAASGWKVTIVASGRNLPEKPLPGIQVIRVGGLAFNRASHLKRALSYLSLYPRFLFVALKAPRHDWVITLTDPPLHLVLGPVLRLIKRSRILHWAQDIYPEVAEQLGVLKSGGAAAGILRWISTFSLRRCDAIVTVGRCMKDRLLSRGLPPSKIKIIPNWTLDAAHHSDSQSGAAEFRKLHSLGGKFVVMYSGNFGLAHPFESIINSVKDLRTNAAIHFVFLGGGPRYEWVRQHCQGLANATFLPYQPQEKLNASLGSGDLHLACMEPNLQGLVVPSKIYGILAAGKPCLFLGPKSSEAALLIRELDAGWCLEAQQFAELTPTLLQAARQPETLLQMGERAKAYSRSHGSLEAAKHFQDLFKEMNPNHPHKAGNNP